MRFFLTAVVFLACSSEEAVKVHNSTPTVAITSHADGETFQDGYNVQFFAQVQDDNHESASLKVAWYSDVRTLCPEQSPTIDGVSQCSISLQEGETVVRVQVTDPDDAAAIASIEVAVEQTFAPTVEIISPQPQGLYYTDQLILLSATVQDTEDLASDLSYEWESSLDGVLSTTALPNEDGLLEEYLYLSAGAHALTLKVTDLSGKTTEKSISFEVRGPNTNPACTIVSPNSGDSFVIGEDIIFQATAIDEEVETDTLEIVWISDKDGELGSGLVDSSGEVSFSYSGLSADTHTILFKVKDELQSSCSDSIIISVGTPPTLTVTNPLDGDVFTQGELIQFTGTVVDSEDLSSTIPISWVSDIDGEFSTQGANSNGDLALNVSTLSLGLHSITVTATDSDGFTDSTLLSVRINALPTMPQVTLIPEPAGTEDMLTAAASGSTDPEGNNVTYVYTWYNNNGLSSYTGVNLPSSATSKGETWTVRATPNDGYQDGPYAEASLIIQNTGPSIVSSSVTPSAPNTNDLLTCNVAASDADSDPLVENYTWTNTTTGASLGSTSNLQLHPDIVSPGDGILCSYEVSDGVLSDTSSYSVVVNNTGPTVNAVTIAPTTAFVGTVLTCSVDVDDPDLLGYTEEYTWTNGTTGATLGTSSTLTVDAATSRPTDQIVCSVSVVDPSGASGSDSTSIVLGNQDPIITSVTVSPTGATLSDTVLCEEVVVEPDGETPTISYEWFDQNDVLLGTEAFLQLNGTSLAGGDVLRCVVTAQDDYGGAATGAAAITLGNSAPTVDFLAIDATQATTSQTLSCTGVSSDIDGDVLTESYVWTNETTETVLGSASTITLSPLSAAPGDSIGCTYTVNDGADDATQTVIVGVINTDPTITSVSIVPSSPYLGDTLNCLAVVQDVDLETTTETYLWENQSTGATIASSGSIVLDAMYASPDDVIACTVTAVDPSGGTVSASTTATVSNLPPTIDTLEFDVTSVALGDSITCVSTESDPEGEIPSVDYAWRNETTGTDIGSGPGLTLNSTMATGLDEISCTATATDGYGATDSESISIFVDSTAPEFTLEANISPDYGLTTSSSVGCEGVAVDPDGTTVVLAYTWTVGSSVLGTTQSITLSPTSIQPTDVLRCLITATDSSGEQATSSASVMIGNQAPSLSSETITPSSGIYTSTTLTCSAVVSDADLESLTPTYTWTNGTTSLGTGDTLTLDPTTAQPGDTITCTADVSDGYGATDSVFVSVTVENIDPVIDSIEITPATAYNDSNLNCVVGSSDADAQTLSINYTWTNGTTGDVLGTADTLQLDDAIAARNDVISCTATATDGSGGSVSDNVSISLENRAPSVPLVGIAPTTAYIDSTLTCTPTGSVDSDGDAISYVYEWTVNSGSVVGTSSTFSAGFVAGDIVTCTVTPNDGLIAGTSGSGSITIENSIPVVSAVVLSPDPVYTNNILTATATYSDLDNDALGLSYAWSVDGTEVQAGTTNTLSNGLFSKGQTVSVSVVANDGTDTSIAATASAIVANTVPTAPLIEISPSVPVEQEDDVVCSVTTAAADEDSDSVTYAFAWTVDGVAYTGATDAATSSTVSALQTNATEEWICTVTPNDGEDDGDPASTTVVIDSGWDGTVTFSNCGNIGVYGPSQSDCDSEYSGTNLDGLVSLSSGIQQWTIPSSGTYTIEAQGAAGGNISGYAAPGYGARMIGEFDLLEGQVLNIVVGQAAYQNRYYGYVNSGGGGGTFIWIDGETTPILVAGGGGGVSNVSSVSSNVHATTGTSGNPGTNSNGSTSGTSGGSGGTTGTMSYTYSAGAGAGWSTGSPTASHYNCSYSPQHGGGFSGGFIGGNGGSAGQDCNNSSPCESMSGGFGGGGGASGACTTSGSGGGGGYSGGGVGTDCCSANGGGGGSYNTGDNQDNTGGYNSGHGMVIIDKL